MEWWSDGGKAEIAKAESRKQKSGFPNFSPRQRRNPLLLFRSPNFSFSPIVPPAPPGPVRPIVTRSRLACKLDLSREKRGFFASFCKPLSLSQLRSLAAPLIQKAGRRGRGDAFHFLGWSFPTHEPKNGPIDLQRLTHGGFKGTMRENLSRGSNLNLNHNLNRRGRGEGVGLGLRLGLRLRGEPKKGKCAAREIACFFLRGFVSVATLWRLPDFFAVRCHTTIRK